MSKYLLSFIREYILILLVVYLIGFLLGFYTKKHKKLYLTRSGFSLAIIAILFFAILFVTPLGGAILFIDIGGVLIFPIIGYLFGLLSTLTFEKVKLKDGSSFFLTIVGFLIICWPLALVAHIF